MKNFLIQLDSLLSKRQKFIITSSVTFIGFILVTHRSTVIEKKYHFIILFALVIYLLSLWSMRQAMTKSKAILLFVLPIGYISTICLFYFLFSQIRWLTRLPLAIMFALSFYCLLLTQNVFHIASDRLIPLFRAATTANFVYTLFTLVLIHCIVFSMTAPFYINGVLIFLTSFPLIFQILWSVKIEGVTPQIVVYSAIFSLILAEAGIALSFWSAPPLVLSLYLNSITYGVLGVILELMKDRLNNKVVYEYGLVAGVLFFTILSITTYFTF
jgi:hypothetical protein